MRVLKVLVLPALLFLLVTAGTGTPTPPASPSPTATASPTPPPPTPSPLPTPTPTAAFLSLDVSAGDPNTQIHVSGNSFLANEKMSLYWDSPNKVIGSATADGNGNFSNVAVKPFAGDPPGLHKICASVAPNPCAQFELQAPTPSPSPEASPSESPTAVESPSPSPSGSPTPSVAPIPVSNDSPNNLDVLFKPPFVFLPFIAVLGLLGAIAYWAFGAAAARRRVQPLPAASVIHYSARPQPGLPGIPYTPPPAAASPGPVPPAGPQEFTPEELQPPWPSLDRPPSDEPDPPRD